MDDVRRVTYWTLGVFIVGVAAWIVFLFLVGCGFSTSCPRGASLAVGDRTPIPTLVPATLPAGERNQAAVLPTTCEVAAVDLLGAWVSAGYPEATAFQFESPTAGSCTGSFPNDVLPLFVEGDIWSAGSLACTACHGSDLAASPGRLDLGSFAGIVAGSQPGEPEGKSVDVLGGGNWQESILYQTLLPGHPPGALAGGPIVFAGAPQAAPAP